MDGRRGRVFAPTAVLYEPNTLQLMKRIIRIVVLVVLVVAAILVGGSLYLLRYSLRPEAAMEAKNATSYEYMYGEYPFCGRGSTASAGWGRCAIRRSSGARVNGCMPFTCGPRSPRTARRSSFTATRTMPCGC